MPAPLDIASLEALCAAATPEPWSMIPFEASDPGDRLIIADNTDSFIVNVGFPTKDYPSDPDPQETANGKFICAARTALPAALAEIAALRKVRDAARRLRSEKGVTHFLLSRTIEGHFEDDIFVEDPAPPMECAIGCAGCALDAALKEAT